MFVGIIGNMFDFSFVICVGGDYWLYCWVCVFKLWYVKYFVGFYIFLWYIVNYNIVLEKLDCKVY